MSEHQEFIFTEENLIKSRESIAKYPENKQASAVLSLLQLAQYQIGGWLTKDAINYVAKILNMAPIRVYEVATFYNMFYLEPVGKYCIKVCRTTPCWLRGSDEIMHILKKELDIQEGQTTKDGIFTLIEVECLCACINSPVIAINNDYYENLNEAKIIEIINRLKK